MAGFEDLRGGGGGGRGGCDWGGMLDDRLDKTSKICGEGLPRSSNRAMMAGV
jgi:hypothetical protein